MSVSPRTVFVLGAGFTRAFLPQAPLVKDDYGSDRLMARFEGFPNAKRVLKSEISRNASGFIDIERLMTRIDGLMPYDFENAAAEELRLLLSAVKRAFIDRIERAKGGSFHKAQLGAFAAYCSHNHVDCITFNYDDILDEALWDVDKVTHVTEEPAGYWHPDGGYGFFCRPSETCIRSVQLDMDRTSMLLLKLHGSVNWRPRRGYPRPYSVDAIVHHEPWQPPLELAQPEVPESKPSRAALEVHLEPEAFIVPPVLVKSALVEEPILRIVWSHAYKVLAGAEQVFFVGYSLPTTDLAAGFLFREALSGLDLSRITVINKAPTGDEQALVRDTYSKALPGIPNDRFRFMDALEWAAEMAGERTS